uniref:Uncharacterized protein n=1 Tax=Anguilla anguilla TaxID=7936 RepID=A0A0E9UTX3_ANGAN
MYRMFVFIAKFPRCQTRLPVNHSCASGGAIG